MARAQAMHVKASLMNLRTESLGAAAHHMRQANDAIANGLPIGQVKEYQRRAVAALQQAQTELEGGVSDSVDTGGGAALAGPAAALSDSGPKSANVFHATASSAPAPA